MTTVLVFIGVGFISWPLALAVAFLAVCTGAWHPVSLYDSGDRLVLSLLAISGFVWLVNLAIVLSLIAAR